jgi:RES domain-containing protein
VYLAPNPAGALVEVLVHLEIDVLKPPKSYRLMKVDTAGDLSTSHLDVSGLPPDWQQNLLATRSAGDEWLAGAKSVLLEVPSAILPETSNYILNPSHPDAHQLRVLSHESYMYDLRLFGTRTK